MKSDQSQIGYSNLVSEVNFKMIPESSVDPVHMSLKLCAQLAWPLVDSAQVMKTATAADAESIPGRTETSLANRHHTTPHDTTRHDTTLHLFCANLASAASTHHLVTHCEGQRLLHRRPADDTSG